MQSYKSPPGWANRILNKVLPSDLVDEVEGDLYEAFQWRASEKGLGYARRKYLVEVFKCLRYFKFNVKIQNYRLMLIQNYLKTGFRFLWKTRGYSSLNILGLALGIAISWLAYIFVTDEYSYDGFYKMADRTYRITSSATFGDQSETFAGSSYIMGEEYPKQIPQIEYASRYKNGYFLTRSGEEYLDFSPHYADKDFFEIFDVDFIIGGIGSFNEPNQLVISESTAMRYDIPIDLSKDELISVRNGEETAFKVIGIYKDFPLNTSIRPRAIFPFIQWSQSNEDRTKIWFDINMNTFFTLTKGVNREDVESKMTEVLLSNSDMGENEVTMGLQPLKNIHLNPNLRTGNGIEARGDNEMILISLIIGILCLVIACVNYANFAVGNYLVRLKEVSLRKVFGAEKTGVFRQFVTETFISTFIALCLSIGFIYLILPPFADYAGKTYTIEAIFSLDILAGGFLILLVTTFFAGIYPALLLSRFKTMKGLRGKSQLGGKNWLSKSLLILQFCIAVFLIAGTLVMDKQLDFMLNYDIGYRGKDVISLFRPMSDEQTQKTFKNRLLRIPGVESVSMSSGFNGTDYTQDDGENVTVSHARVDEDYLSTLGMTLLEGRNFDESIPTDFTKAIIVNEAFVKYRKMDDPIGQQINFEYGDFQKPTIIGVVKNFNFESLHSPIEPLVLYMGGYLRIWNTQIKTTGLNSDIIEAMDKYHSEFFSPYQMNYTLVEDDIARQYELEASIQKVSKGGAFIAIFLSCIGLMGFVGTQIRQKLKEVSIRKVVGARPHEIFKLYISKYLVLLSIGMCIGLAGAIYMMQNWLSSYPEKISFGIDIGIIALGSVSAVALITIFSQLYKAVKLNPVVYLKDE